MKRLVLYALLASGIPLAWKLTQPALEPSIGSPICYAAPGGSATASGMSWGNALPNLMACYDQLPSTGGTIMAMDGGAGKPLAICKPTDPVGCGIWIMGGRDTNYAAPPPGWRHAKQSVRFVGVAGSLLNAFATSPQVQLAGGSSSANQPVIWLSDTYSHTFTNFAMGYPRNAIWLGKDSTGSRTNTNASAWNDYFFNIGARVAGLVGYGPTVEIGTNSDWDHFQLCQISGNEAETAKVTSCSRVSGLTTCTATLPSSYAGAMNLGIVGASNDSFDGLFAATITSPTQFTFAQPVSSDATSSGGVISSDAAQAVLVNPLGSATPGVGLLDFQNTTFSTTGIRAYAGGSGFSLNASNLFQENGLSPTVHISGCSLPTSNAGGSIIQNVLVADNAVNPLPGVRVDNAAGCRLSAVTVTLASVDGQVTNAGSSGPSNPSVLPSVMGQSGIYMGRVFAQDDAARRGFGPVATRFPNLARTLPSSWVNNPAGGICVAPAPITAAPSPDGNMLAGTSTTGAGPCFSSGPRLLNVGDSLIIAAWARSDNANGFARNSPIQFSCTGCTLSTGTTYMAQNVSFMPGAGEWTFYKTAATVIKSTGSNSYAFYGNIDATHPADFFAPVLNIIPAGSIVANELAYYTQYLQSYRPDSIPGQVSLLSGQQFKADTIQIGGGPTLTSGPGAPTVSAVNGSIYMRQDGSSGTSLYIYENGSWQAKF